ncbi:unnamed protein product [Rotaria sp. Silwood2]|nr:unnamed protein product [Rotaria sp. Silwood2]CAF4267622.1 unnamed protein product [Rotaria sp. Silwood2]
MEKLASNIRRVYKLVYQDKQITLAHDDENMLENACRKALSNELFVFLESLDAVDNLLPFVIHYITTLDDLAEVIFNESQSSNLELHPTIAAKLKSKLELRYKFLVCGGLKDDESSIKLLNSICEQHPNLLSFRKLSYDRLVSDYLSGVKEYQKDIIENVWMEGNELRMKMKQYDLPFSWLDKLAELGVSRPDQLTDNVVNRLVQMDKTAMDKQLSEFKTDKEKMSLTYDKHNTFKANLTEMTKKESRQGKEETANYEKELKKQRELTDKSIESVKNIKANLEKSGQNNKDQLKSKLKDIESKFKTDWHINEDQLSRPEELLNQVLCELNERKTQLDLGEAYKSDEDIIERISGGIALCGIDLTDPKKLSERIDRPLLSRPISCLLKSPSLTGGKKSKTFTSLEASNQFTQTIKTSGITVATDISASVLIVHANAGFSRSSEERSNSSDQQRTLSKIATRVEYVSAPMKCFRISPEEMKLSTEAENELIKVDTLPRASVFLHRFGSHLSDGTQHIGGVFIRTVTVKAEEETNVQELENIAGNTMSASASVGVSYSTWSAGAGVSAERSKAEGSLEGTQKVKAQTQVTTHTDCMGPYCLNPDLFVQMLYSNNSSWHVIDRGPLSSFIPIWRVIFRRDSYRPEIVAAAKLLQRAWLSEAIVHVYNPLIKNLINEEMQHLEHSEYILFGAGKSVFKSVSSDFNVM